MTDRLRNFIRDHADDDVWELMLKASQYKGIDLRFAVGQIAARRQVKDKLPSWYADDRLIFPSALAAEQCSSELTATYKQRLVDSDDEAFDLTGGLGVDSYFLSRKVRRVTYVERNAEYCETATYNMKRLGAHNVDILHGDAVDLITGDAERLSAANVFYIDPARRGDGNRRMFALEDCDPDLTKIWPLLRKKRVKIIVKLSPMLDIGRVLSQLPGVTEVHVVSVRNDCKELLAVSSDDAGKTDVKICCVNFTSSGEEQAFWFGYDGEKTATVSYAETVGRYLYEPNASLLKAGAYRTVSSRYGLKKLHVSSHLYTADTCIPSFAGRIFEVKNVYKFDNRLCRELSAQIPRANISVRNFPLSVDELRRRTRI
ncbi:MAG: class I SAM-dependent methyltransferase, partial [Tannerella sp.]|nr:class I SAM-dependent methyltransferase [Tannerella sp.]